MGDLVEEIHENSTELSDSDLDEQYENYLKTVVIHQNINIEDAVNLLDGMHNIQPPEGWVEPEDEPNQVPLVDCKTCEKIFFYEDVISETEKVPPYISDEIRLPFSPEDIYILTQYLKTCSLNITENKYLSEHKGITDLYEQQEYLRYIINSIEEIFDEYIQKRPYTPFLAPWLKRINKYSIRNKSE